MVISQTPLRISFAGGGSDIPEFYKKFPGAVVSTTINKYIYITVNKKFDNLIRASYSVTEFAKNPDELKNELIRESLKHTGIYSGLEITSISDIPSGTGLGSSSSYTVGLLNALNAYRGVYSSQKELAQSACDIEIKHCHKPVGKQDQYAAAFGGFNLIEFNTNGVVNVTPVIMKQSKLKELEDNLLLLYMGKTRSADKILSDQVKKMSRENNSIESLKKMAELARELHKSLSKNDINKFGEILDQNWQLKKKLSNYISNSEIDGWYEIAKKNGAIGGKVLGAGGGGFLLFYAPSSKHSKIINALPELGPTSFSFEKFGSKIIYYQH